MNLDDGQLINAISKGGLARDESLRRLIMDETLHGHLYQELERMGGRKEDVSWLMDEALIDLVRLIQNQAFSEKESVGNFILGRIRMQWLARLGRDDLKRKQVMEHIAADSGLKERILIKMRKLGCQAGEDEDMYNQGYVKLSEVLYEKKYKGGDIKGLFFRICEHLRLNDRRKSRELLPEILPDRGVAEIERIVERKEKTRLLKKWLKQIGEKCRKTLQLWNDGYSMKEIAQKIPYRDHKEAAVAKHRCMKKLFGLIDIRE